MTRNFAFILGVVFLAVGILGFVPGITSEASADATMHAMRTDVRHLFGLFPVNTAHNLVHLFFGAVGIFAAVSYPMARNYARTVAIAYLLLAVCGIVPGLKTLFGYIPLFGHDIWLHLAIGAIAAIFGWPVPRPATDSAAVHTTPEL
ncbi:MAG TPA: DUF4383 domain-containing protein [Tepidisphaeraceae bacterium]|jgi:hypothetical protein